MEKKRHFLKETSYTIDPNNPSTVQFLGGLFTMELKCIHQNFFEVDVQMIITDQ